MAFNTDYALGGAATPPARLHSAGPMSVKPLCVMIVEDDPFIAIDMEDSFREAGFEVMGPFARPERAIAACLERTPDVATLDYQLMDTTSRSIAETLDRHDVPLVMVTSSEREMRTRKAFARRECFNKPCDMDELIERTRELADS